MNTKKIVSVISLFIFAVLINFSSRAQAQPAKNDVKFTKFAVSTDKKRVAIAWSTNATVATNYFEIQKSFDGVNFQTIALVLGPDPKQPSGDCYGCFDKYTAKNARHSFYRLKHISTDGVEQLSEIKLLVQL